MALRPVFQASELGTLATVFSEAAVVGERAIQIAYVSILIFWCNIGMGEHTKVPAGNANDTRHDREENLCKYPTSALDPLLLPLLPLITSPMG